MIPFIDLKAQQDKIRSQLDEAVARVMNHGTYILGPEVGELETALSEFCGVKHAITCSSGTDALSLVLMALGIKAGDAVLVPSFTYIATAEVVSLVGATPIFVDVKTDTFNICPESLAKGYDLAKDQNLNPVGIIPVDLFGQPADYNEIEQFANDKNLWVLCDAAQSFGATYKDKKVGTTGLATTTSFFPAKPLGCYGDGGAVFTDNDDLAETMRSIRVHGKGQNKYDNIRIGLNARMDTLQAAILLEKIKLFPDELIARQALANRYTETLKDHVTIPILESHNTSSWAQYTIQVDAKKRDTLAAALKDQGIPTAIYYPKPLHQQDGYSHYPHVNPVTSETLSQSVLSLPMHPYMDDETADLIIESVIESI